MARTTRVVLDRIPIDANLNETRSLQLAPLPADGPRAEDVAREAYAIYLAHGAEDGHALDHWLEAEQRITQLKRAGTQ